MYVSSWIKTCEYGYCNKILLNDIGQQNYNQLSVVFIIIICLIWTSNHGYIYNNEKKNKDSVWLSLFSPS